jgi:hypothetical protein
LKSKITVIFVRQNNEKINKNLFKKAKENNLFYLLLNFGRKIISDNRRIINNKKKYINSLFEKIIFSKNSSYFLFVNASADEKYLTGTIERTIWYFEKHGEKAGAIDFTTSCSFLYHPATEEPRLFPFLSYNLNKTFILNKFYFAVKKEVLSELISHKVESSFFKEKIEYLVSFICFYKKLLVCKDTTYKILLDNNLKKELKKSKSVFELDKKMFERYTNFYYVLFIETLIFIVWKIPSIDFTSSSKTIGILNPILKKRLK